MLGTGTAVAQDVNALPNLRIELGSTARVGFDTAGKPVVTGTAAPALTAGELDMLGQTAGRAEEAIGEKSLPIGTGLPTPAIEKNHVSFTFVATADGEHSLLVIRNGLDRSFAYKARIGVGAKSTATDVCQVLPALMAIEHWPYKIDWIEVTGIRATEWKDGDAPRCE